VRVVDLIGPERRPLGQRAGSGAGGNRPVDILNLGPGAIFIRADKDPTTSDMNSLQLPANWSANRLNVESNTGLGIIAAADTTIGVRAY
jgi:hypothetical protein